MAAPHEYVEIEIKLAVDDSTAVPDMRQLPGVSALASTSHQQLSAIYYDTADLRLTREKITLRRRTGGPDDGWHMKIPAGQGRTELRCPLQDPHTVPQELVDAVRAIVRRHPLQPIAQVDNHRVETILADEEGQPVAEFCDDHVSARSLLPGGSHTTWREWELELTEQVAGTNAGASLLRQAERYLLSSGARPSSSPSKLTSALGDSLAKAPLPPHLTEAHLSADSPLHSLLTSVRTLRDTIVHGDRAVRADQWDSVHQQRVAIRELRSILRTFDGLVQGDAFSNIEKELKHVAGVLGVARDAEVVHARWLQLLDTDDSGCMDDAAAAHLREDMHSVYKLAHRNIVNMCNSDAYLNLLDAIDELIANPPQVREGIQDNDEALARHVRKAYKKLMKRHAKVDDRYHDTSLPRAKREAYVHDVRKAAKRLRYAAAATGDPKFKRLIKACKRLQSMLGDFQDCATSREELLVLAKLARQRDEDVFAYGMCFQRELRDGEKALRGYFGAIREVKKAAQKAL